MVHRLYFLVSTDKIQIMNITDQITTFILGLSQYLESNKNFSDEILNRLDKIEDHIYNKNNDSYLDTLVPIKEISSKLGISQRKLFDLRKRGEIDFVIIGKKIFITQKEIDLFIERHSTKNNQPNYKLKS